MNYQLRFHPLVELDLNAITQWIVLHSGPGAAQRTVDEIELTITTLADLPHRGSVRDRIAPRLRAIPAGRKGVVAFTVDDEARDVLIIAVTYGGADWAARSQSRIS